MAGDTTTKINEKSGSSGPIVNRADLAAALGLSEPTINARVREGMPCRQHGSRGKAWEFSLAECIAWDKSRAVGKAVGVVQDGTSKAELERRLLTARVKREEIEAAKAAAEVAPVEEIERAVTAAFTEVRQAMLSLPERLALRLLAADGETEIKGILRSEIDLALHALSEADLLDGFDDPSA